MKKKIFEPKLSHNSKIVQLKLKRVKLTAKLMNCHNSKIVQLKFIMPGEKAVSWIGHNSKIVQLKFMRNRKQLKANENVTILR